MIALKLLKFGQYFCMIMLCPFYFENRQPKGLAFARVTILMKL
jgi:hypothetical protein